MVAEGLIKVLFDNNDDEDKLRGFRTRYNKCIQGVKEISAIIVTDDYLCYKEPKSPYNFFSYFNI